MILGSLDYVYYSPWSNFVTTSPFGTRDSSIMNRENLDAKRNVPVDDVGELVGGACQTRRRECLDHTPTVSKSAVLSYSGVRVSRTMRTQYRDIGYTMCSDIGCFGR